jgi:peptidoglycan/xylan/chitin deacetylase (PgdA/CDA1 family)
MLIPKIYYHLKPLIPRNLQITLRRQLVRRKRNAYVNVWPIDEKAGEMPAEWSGWPDQKRFALVLTHDVDTAKGQEKCHHLINLEKEMGFRSSFNFVPERYHVSQELRDNLIRDGFEVGVHGLNHDGKLYSSREVFQERALRINEYLKEWEASGFRSPAMHHNLEWIHDLNIEYDASSFDTDPFEPYSDGVGTIFPFWVHGNSSRKGYVELPYTLPQDFTLFILMKEKNIDIWKHKLDWIAQKGGMALLNVHPDYMNFEGKEPRIEEYAAVYYQHFLEYIKSEYEGQYWHILPCELASFFVKDFCNNQKI